MPVAFFTRTRTGALVSRLNNDVIGAQRAFSDTLSGVVSNLVTLLLTLGVMLSISWQITLLALVLLPVFVLPARRMGARLAQLEREAADHNAAMGTQMTERFSAPGATLVKLFGRPADESRRVRRPGARGCATSGCARRWCSGCSSPRSPWSRRWRWPWSTGSAATTRCAAGWTPGAVVALALLLTRLYAPLTALAGARVEVMSALVSFERVFEVLDLKPLIAEKPDARHGARRAGVGGVRRRPLRLPVGRQGVAGLAGGGRRRSTPAAASRCCTASRSAPSRARWSRWSARPAPASRPIAQLLPRLYDVDGGAVRLAGVDVRDLTADSIRDTLGHGHPGRAPLPRVDPRQPAAGPARGDRGRAVGRAAPRPARRAGRGAARRAGHRRRRARLPALRRRTPAADHRPAAAGPPAGRRSSTRPPRIWTPPPRRPSRRRSPRRWPGAPRW